MKKALWTLIALFIMGLCVTDALAAPRRQIRQVSRDQYGNALASATCHVEFSTDKGATWADATVYSTLAGTTAATGSNITADSSGVCTAYLDDFDYQFTSTAFRVTVTKTGYTSATYTNIVVGPQIGGTYTISADTTVTTGLDIPQGVILSIATGKVLTINGPFNAGNYQTFSCTGTEACVKFANLGELRPEWFGATGGLSSDNSTALNTAMKVAWASRLNTNVTGQPNPNRVAVRLTGWYKVTSPVVVYGNGIDIFGSGPSSSGIVNYTVATNALIVEHSTSYTESSGNTGFISMRDFGVIGTATTAAAGNGIVLDGPSGEFRFNNIDSSYHGNHGLYSDGNTASIGSWVIAIDRSYFIGNYGNGIDTVSYASKSYAGNAMTVSNSLMFANSGYGIAWLANGLNFTGNTLERNGLGQMYIGVPAGSTPISTWTGPVNIKGNYFETTASYTNAIQHIWIYAPTSYPIYGISIADNFFTGGHAAVTGWRGMIYASGGGALTSFFLGYNLYAYVDNHTNADLSDMPDKQSMVYATHSDSEMTSLIQRFDNLGDAVKIGGMSTDLTTKVNVNEDGYSYLTTSTAVRAYALAQNTSQEGTMDYTTVPRYRGDQWNDRKGISYSGFDDVYFATFANNYTDDGIITAGQKPQAASCTASIAVSSYGDWVKENDQVWVPLSDGSYFKFIADKGAIATSIPVKTCISGGDGVLTTTTSGFYINRWVRMATYGYPTMQAVGYEAGDATLQLWADNGDDAADKWSIVSQASTNNLSFQNNGTESVRIDSTGGIMAINYVSVLGAEGASASIYMASDEGDDATDSWIIRVQESGNNMTWYNNSSPVAALTPTGGFSATSITVTGGTLNALAKAFNMSYTLDDSVGAANIGAQIDITGAGTEAQVQRGILITSSGYTGASQFQTVRIESASTSTGNSFASTGAIGNFGIAPNATGATAGANIGSGGNAANAAVNIGALGTAGDTEDSQVNYGVRGIAKSTGAGGIAYGGHFSIDATSGSGAAVAADNLTSTNNIAEFKDNSVTRWAVIDGGDLVSYGPTAGTLSQKSYEGVSAAMSGASVTITMSIPTAAQIIGTVCRIETAVTSGDGGSTLNITYSGGSTLPVGTAYAFAKDTKAISYGTDVTTNTTNIALTPDTGTFNAGVVRCVTFTKELAIANTP